MKKLLILPLLALLTGCVTYYYPETAMEDGVYYAEDDPSYNVYSDGYAGVAYYPWSSLDYFYLGYNPYPGFSIGYGYGSGFSIGLSYGYSPWYYPHHYHGYYSPWYASHYYYPYYPAWRPYRGYYSHHNGGHHKNRKNHRGDGRDRYAGNDNNDRRDRGSGDEDRRREIEDRNNRDLVENYNSSSTRRYVSTAPAGNSGNRGMVIRSRESTKVSKSRLHSEAPVTTPSVETKSVSSRATRPKYSTTRAGNEVRYRSDAKQTRSRTTPVKSGSSSSGVVIASASPRTAPVSSHSGRSSQPVRANARREAPRQPPASSNSRPTAQPKPKAASASNSRSRPSPSHSNGGSKNKASSRQRNRR